MTRHAAAALGHAVDLAFLDVEAFLHHDLADDVAGEKNPLPAYTG
jgi:hypothetical protein